MSDDPAPFRPRAVEGLETIETDEGIIIYDDRTDLVHNLNNTAAVIFCLCDGTATTEEIAATVAEVFGLNEIPATETATCVRDLQGRRLVLGP